MQFTESSPRQAEHFEWLNTIDFYQSYLDIMQERFNTVSMHNGHTDGHKLAAYADMLNYLNGRLQDIRDGLYSHMEELEEAEALENRLNFTSQSVHHFGVREKIELFEEMLNGFRTEFNEFYVNNL